MHFLNGTSAQGGDSRRFLNVQKPRCGQGDASSFEVLQHCSDAMHYLSEAVKKLARDVKRSVKSRGSVALNNVKVMKSGVLFISECIHDINISKKIKQDECSLVRKDCF